MSTLRRFLGVATVVDDRAQRVEIVTSAEMLAPLTVLQRLLLWRWLGPALIFGLFVSTVAAPEVVIVLLFLGWWLIPIGLLLLVGARRRRLLALSRGALAAGLCGACGYRIEDRHLDADGKRVCPECGGAWIANAGVPPPDEAADIFRKHYAQWYARTMVGTNTVGDHRGCIMPRMVRSDPASVQELSALEIRGLAGSTGPKGGALSRTRSGIALMVLGVFLFFFAIQLQSEWETSTVVASMVFAVVLGILGAWLVWSAMFRLDSAGILRAGLCPACTLPISPAAPEADGCVKCPSCWAAWRATDIGATPPAPGSEP